MIEPLAALVRGRRHRASKQQSSDPSTAMASAKGMRSIIGHDLSSFLDSGGIDQADAVFVPSADAELVLAIAEQLHARAKPPRFYLRLMYDDVGCHRTDPTWRSALQVLLDAPDANGRVRFLAETHAFAKAMEAIWPAPIAVLPHPSDLPATPVPDPGGDFVVYLAGQSRTDKGGPLVHAVARALATELGPARRAVQLRVQGGIEISYGKIQIERLPHHLYADDYALNWRQAHAALFLHDPKVYALRGSGVVCDAMASARPFIYLNGSSLSEWSARGNALGTDPLPEVIAQTIVKLMDDYPRIAGMSAIAAPTLADSIQTGLSGLGTDHAKAFQNGISNVAQSG